MSRNQRLSFLGIAAVIAALAVAILAFGSGPDETAEDADAPAARQQTATPPATEDGAASETPEPTPTPTPKPPLLTAGEVTRLRFTEGETIRFRARSDVDEEIHVHGYDRYIDLPAGETVDVSFDAGITGIFEVELHGAGEQIAQLRVDPE